MNRPNDRFQSIAPEEIEVGKAYTLTINPEKVTGDLVSDYKHIKKIVQGYSHIRHLEMKLFPEYSKFGKLHAHGTFKCNDVEAIVRFYEHMPALKKEATFKIDHLKTERVSEKYETWAQYCLKNKHLMKPVLNNRGLHYAITP